ncbi:MAG: hypothetical protein K0Q77_32 [Anaerosporomusa subterranea]|jgi:hypothetical protein|nr:hypothetical protein [Anaerosporomusa subterranea]
MKEATKQQSNVEKNEVPIKKQRIISAAVFKYFEYVPSE